MHLLLLELGVVAAVVLVKPVIVSIFLPTLLANDIILLHFGVLMTLSVVIRQITPALAIAPIITSRLSW